MKRRSARPFMVEVKQTRAARTSPNAANPRIPSDTPLWRDNLWQDLIADDEKPSPPPSRPPVPAPVKAVDAPPARRVLPNLMPTFDASAEAEPEPVADPVPRVRRPRGRPPKASVASPAPALTPAAPPPAVRQAAAVVAKPSTRTVPLAAVEAPPVPTGSDRAPPVRLARRKGEELRLGERWKRRLPQFMR